MRSFWEESPEDKVERLTEEVETLRFEQERHAEELKEKMESQFHQQQYESRMRAETEREERQREESEREHRAHRERLSTSHHSLVKRILEAAVCAKRGTELSSEDVAEKAMDNFLNFIAKLMADKVYLIAEFPEYVKTMSAEDYADFKIRPRDLDADEDDDDDEDDGLSSDPVRNYLKGFHKQWDQAQRSFARRHSGGYGSLDGRKLEEANRIIDFETAVPALRDALKKLGASAELQEKAEKLAEVMAAVSGTLREHADAARKQAEAEVEQERASRKRKRAENAEFAERLRPLQELAKNSPDGSRAIKCTIVAGALGSLYLSWGWTFKAQLGMAVVGAVVGAIVLFIPFSLLEVWIDKFLLRTKGCEVCGWSRFVEEMLYCDACHKVLCKEGHSDCCEEPNHWPLKRGS